MHAALMRPDAVGMAFIEREKMAAILQNDSSLWLYDAGAKSHKVALNKRYEIAFAVGRSDILCIISNRNVLRFQRGATLMNLPAQLFYPCCGHKIAGFCFHEIAIREIAVTIGERKLLSLDHQVQSVGALQTCAF